MSYAGKGGQSSNIDDYLRSLTPPFGEQLALIKSYVQPPCVLNLGRHRRRPYALASTQSNYRVAGAWDSRAHLVALLSLIGTWDGQ